MVSTVEFYGGANYGNSYGGGEFLDIQYGNKMSSLSLATNPFTANQIQDVSTKLNTGAKAIEVNLAFVDPRQGGAPAESIPNQHLQELNRLKKITGVDFTMHGALVEPTGFTRQGWEETQRQQAERQMWESLKKSKLLDPDGNIVVTFHSSNGLPAVENKVWDERIKGEDKNLVTDLFVIDEKDGQITSLPLKENELLGLKAGNKTDSLNKINTERWTSELSRITHSIHIGENELDRAIISFNRDSLNDDESFSKLKDKDIIDLYAESKNSELREQLNKLSPEVKKVLDKQFGMLDYGQIYVKEAYNSLQNNFNTAHYYAKKDGNEEDLKKLDAFKEEIRSKAKELNDPKNIKMLADEVLKGVNILNSIKTPDIIRPLRDFGIDKASDTFSNLALKSFKEYKDRAPIISIENPPAGSGLDRADDLKDLIDKSRDKFAKEAVRKFGMSESEAKNQAEKLIGATWDVGHINMIRKFGYDESELKKETQKIAPYIKNVHLSDNFGMEHTELPMGMGNVPIKSHMEIIEKFNKFKGDLKKVIETGNWYQHFGQNNYSNLTLNASAFGSAMFADYPAMTWSHAYASALGGGVAGYSAGLGMNPDVHHSIYGAGFSGLPTELGGQIPGRQSRFSGTAME